MAQEHTTDKYRTSQALIPADVEKIYVLLRDLQGKAGAGRAGRRSGA